MFGVNVVANVDAKVAGEWCSCVDRCCSCLVVGIITPLLLVLVLVKLTVGWGREGDNCEEADMGRAGIDKDADDNEVDDAVDGGLLVFMGGGCRGIIQYCRYVGRCC